MTSAESAARDLQDHAALWSAGEIPASDVVRSACAALVAGLDGPALRMLAARTRAEADYDVHDLLPAALGELGLVCYPIASEAGREAAVRARARRLLAGELTPRDLTRHVHRRYGHDLALAERLAELDDEYDNLDLGYGDRTAQEIGAEVTAEARRLAAGPSIPKTGPGWSATRPH